MNGSDIHVKIHDEGIGLPNGDDSSINQAFYTIKEDKGGAGLGLSMVVSILQSHQDQLCYETKTMGTCAHVIMPGSVL